MRREAAGCGRSVREVSNSWGNPFGDGSRNQVAPIRGAATTKDPSEEPN